MLLHRPGKRAPSFALLTLAFALSTSAKAITVATVPVGDIGNSNDPATGNHYGGVIYAYNIGLTEVTNAQYTAFLNAVAATDTYGLYDVKMATDANVSGISQTGSVGNYHYSTSRPGSPVASIDWGDAARFANWLHNGQPPGPQNSSTTEDGAYTLNGAVSTAALNAVTRNPNAKWFLPTESEWYKAAYYQPASQGGDTDSYWAYPTKTNSVPYSDQPPGAAPDNTHVVNFNHDDGAANGYDDGYAVTGSTGYSPSTRYLTTVGAYTSSTSYYGTFDQGGNLGEWNETVLVNAYFQTVHGERGGSWDNGSLHLQASIANLDYGTSHIGFRIASAPDEPGAFGDFNGDGSVDSTDYLLWRKSNGSTADYNLWRAHFGENAGGSGTSFSVAIPEPPAIALFASIIALLAIKRDASHWRCS